MPRPRCEQPVPGEGQNARLPASPASFQRRSYGPIVWAPNMESHNKHHVTMTDRLQNRGRSSWYMHSWQTLSGILGSQVPHPYYQKTLLLLWPLMAPAPISGHSAATRSRRRGALWPSLGVLSLPLLLARPDAGFAGPVGPYHWNKWLQGCL